MIHPLADEILERLFYAREDGRGGMAIADLPGNGSVESAVDELRDAQQIVRSGEIVELTPDGELRARGIVRRHRLAEILFTEILQVPRREAEQSACEFEHILAESVVDRVCTFLGHPPQCPHGHPIPQGNCCRIYSKKIEPLITRLVDLPLGSSGSVVFIAPKSTGRLNRLASFGVVPGTTLRLIERKPSVVFSCGHTSIAVEDEIGREIYVRPIPPSSSPIT
ncbi:MAG TPA: metal-dependent transcriptional regulator [Thermoanaerobaculia bacterium]|nr:metal-dependent transcriptional regulator [Thermoanaerobaculia bacterium]